MTAAAKRERYSWPIDNDRELVVGTDGWFRVLVLGQPWPGSFQRRAATEINLSTTIDVRGCDAEHWRSVRLFLRWLSAGVQKPQEFEHWAYKRLRRGHHASHAKDWYDVLPSEVRKWADAELQRVMKDCDCVDNSRVARIGNTGQMRRFRKAKANGCCGCAEWEAVGPYGKRYLLGFNYGH